MSDPYTDLLAQPSAATGAAGGDPYGALLGVDDQQQRFKSTLNLAVGVAPDQAAQQRNIAKQLQTPIAAVEALPDDAKRAAAVQTVEVNTAKAPVLRKKYTEADFAKLAHDDSGVLSGIEATLGALGQTARYLVSADDDVSLMRDVKAGYFGAGAGMAGLFRAGTELVAPVLDVLEPVTSIGGNPLRRLAEGFALVAQQSNANQQFYASKTDGNWMGGLSSGVQSLTQNLMMLPAALMTGGESAVLTGMAGMTGGNSYEKAREAGKGVYQSLAYGASDAVVEYATEKLPMHRLLGDLKQGLPFFQTLVRNAALEIPGEQIATILQDANEWATLHPEKSVGDYLRERPDAAIQTLIATLVGTGGQVSLMHAVQKAVDNATGNVDHMQRAEMFGQQLEALFGSAAESKLRERAPDTFAAVVQQMADETGGAPSAVYIDARTLGEVLSQSGMTPEQLNELLPNTVSQLQDAIAQNGTVAIPTGELLAAAPGTPLEQGLLPHLRSSPEALSQMEAQEAGKQAGEFIKSEAERVMQQAADRQALEQSADAVRTTILDQLNQTKRFRPEANAVYADMVRAFYVTMSQRLGVTPEELYARYPLRVAAEGTGGLAQKAPKKLYRGEASAEDRAKRAGGAAWSVLGKGLYTTRDKKFAAKFGNVVEVSPDEAWPTRPLVIENAAGGADAAVWNWIREQGLFTGRRAEFEAKHPDLGEFIQSLGYDGIAVGDEVVKYAPDVRTPTKAAGDSAAKDATRGAREGAAGNAAEGSSQALAGYNSPAKPGQAFASDSPQGQAGEVSAPPPQVLAQPGTRATFSPEQMLIVLGQNADLSSFLHESGHFFLEVLADLGSQPGAPEQIAKDWQTTLEWFGLTAEQWAGMTLDEKRPYHERWAESVEQYFFEGKAPSVELRGVFDRFRTWLTSVYKSLKQFIASRQNNGVALSDEVRQVMDRLLATDEQIAEAERVRQYGLLFKSPEEAGMTPEQWAKYIGDDEKAHAEALNELGKKSLKNLGIVMRKRMRALREVQADMAEKRKAVEAEAAEQIAKEPVYQAMRWLKKGEMTTAEGEEIKVTDGFKLDAAAVNAIFPESMPGRPDLAKLKGMMRKTDGMDPSIVAEMFGFRDAAHLITSIVEAFPQADQVQGLTDQMMLERYGDAATPRGMERAADEAVHNENRARVLAAEMAAVNRANDARAAGTNGRTVNAMVEAAKQFAENLVGRKLIKDLKPNVHTAAETRAARAAEKALAKGDTQGVIQAKRDQLLNFHAARATNEARIEAAKITAFFKKVATAKDDVVGKTRDIDVVKAAQAILAAYDIGTKGKAAAEYLAVLERNDPAMFAAVKPSIDTALINAKPIDQLTMAELRALNEEVQALWYLAKRSRQMEIDGNLLDRQEVEDDLKARMQVIGIPDSMPGETSAITPAEQRALKLKHYLATARRVESWARGLDGSKGLGPFTRYVWQPVKEAANAYRTDKAKYLKAFRDLLKTVEPTLTKRQIEAPELNYTFGKDTDGVAMAEMLHAILHTGNESNKRKLLLGRKWATENADGTLDTRRWDAFVQRMVNEGILQPVHFDFAQGVWDLLEQTKPLAQKAHRDVFGRYFAEVTADEFVDPFGTKRRGGYVPAQADARIVSDAATRALAEAENASMQFAFPTTNKGFTKGRVEYNRPLMLDLRGLAQHIDKVLLFSHMEQPVRDVRKVLTAKGVAYGLNRIDPAAFDTVLTPWLNRAAKQLVATPAPNNWQGWRFWTTLRNRAGMAAMFGNIANAVQQFAGFSLAAVRVKPSALMSATAQYVANPKQTAEMVASKSEYMDGRLANEVANMNDAINEILINPTVLQSAQRFTAKHAYFLQSAIDNVMGPIIWTGAYNQALAEGMPERDAIRKADAAVRETQGSTAPEDISAFEEGTPFSRLFTQFAGYFNMQANLLGTEFQTLAREMGLRKGVGRGLYVLTFGFLVNAWVAEAIMQLFKGGPDDDDKDGEFLDDWLKQVFGWSLFRNVTAMIPLAGQGLNSLVNATNDKPYDDRMATSPAISMLEAAAKAPTSVYKAIVEDGKVSRAIKDVGTLIALTVGIPLAPVTKPLGYVADVEQGKVSPTGPVDAVRGAVTGAPSGPSKNR